MWCCLALLLTVWRAWKMRCAALIDAHTHPTRQRTRVKRTCTFGSPPHTLDFHSRTITIHHHLQHTHPLQVEMLVCAHDRGKAQRWQPSDGRSLYARTRRETTDALWGSRARGWFLPFCINHTHGRHYSTRCFRAYTFDVYHVYGAPDNFVWLIMWWVMGFLKIDANKLVWRLVFYYKDKI
jgi:hypothetical protein